MKSHTNDKKSNSDPSNSSSCRAVFPKVVYVYPQGYGNIFWGGRVAQELASRCRIRVWWYRGEHTSAAYIHHRHIGPSTGVLVWGAFGYTSRTPLVRFDSTLNSARYISGVLRPVFLPFI
ncbi:uncharacterized protein TNCV_3587311 [Trichonephila clavipes]|nr:uncharacterized protein TNCV_3587311 [Trichonephila clavipes]